MYYYNYIGTGIVEKNIVINRLFTTTHDDTIYADTIYMSIYIYITQQTKQRLQRVLCV